MKVNLSKKIILLIAIVLLAFSVVGTSLAFIFMETLSLQNGFDSAKVSCAVVEKGTDCLLSMILRSKGSGITAW